MNILDTIISAKRVEVMMRKQDRPSAVLEKTAGFRRPVFSLKSSLQDPERNGIIAEFKRRSPSKGIINNSADVLAVTSAYSEYGAAALSVLTDEQFFGGTSADLTVARVHELPILRKDFIIDEYQLVESKSMGADVILLIAACLTVKEVYNLAKTATELGLEVLLELHGESEIEHINEFTPIVGINNRNLKTFSVDIERSLRMRSLLPAQTLKVAESGIDSLEKLIFFRENGFDGFLMGEFFMKANDPARAFRQFAESIKSAPL